MHNLDGGMQLLDNTIKESYLTTNELTKVISIHIHNSLLSLILLKYSF